MTDLVQTTEDETMQAFAKMAEFVGKARDAIVNASALAKEVSELRGQFEALKAEMEEAHRKNADFEQQLAFVRSERDDALKTADNLRTMHTEAVNNHLALQSEHEGLKADHARLQDDWFAVKTQRDDAVMETRRISDELERLQRERDRVIQELESIRNILTPKEPPHDPQTGQFVSPVSEAVGW